MRHSAAAGVAHLKAQKGTDSVSVFASQLLTALCIHPDDDDLTPRCPPEDEDEDEEHDDEVVTI